jgi:hypothetical protein
MCIFKPLREYGLRTAERGCFYTVKRLTDDLTRVLCTLRCGDSLTVADCVEAMSRLSKSVFC